MNHTPSLPGPNAFLPTSRGGLNENSCRGIKWTCESLKKDGQNILTIIPGGAASLSKLWIKEKKLGLFFSTKCFFFARSNSSRYFGLPEARNYGFARSCKRTKRLLLVCCVFFGFCSPQTSRSADASSMPRELLAMQV